MSKDNITEQHILQAAEAVFLEDGFHGARLQKIAQRAQINQASLHYYFRNKENLYRKVLENNLEHFYKLLEVFNDESLSLAGKIEHFVRKSWHLAQERPHLFRFLIMELHKENNVLPLKNIFSIEDSHLAKQLKQAHETGLIAPISVEQFIIYLLSVTHYIFIAQRSLECLFTFSSLPQVVEEYITQLPRHILRYLKGD